MSLRSLLFAGATIVLIVVSLLGVAWVKAGFRFQSPFRVPIVSEMKVLDVVDGNGAATFLCPHGTSYSLLIGVKSLQMQGEGTIEIRSGETNLLFLHVRADELKPSTWLSKHSLNGYIVANPRDGTWEFALPLESGIEYKIVVTNLQPNTSIWLVYRRPSGFTL